MKFHKGFYSLIQFCPDPARLEAVNVGVLLFCPELDFLSAHTVRDNRRVQHVFGREDHDWQQLNLLKNGIEERVAREKRKVKTCDQLKEFIDSRANLIRITDPIPMRVTDPQADLNKLFAQLVADEPDAKPAPRKRFQTVIAERLKKARLGRKLCEGIPVDVPYLKKPVSFPFGFQNGRFNLLQPVSFVSEDPDDSVRKAFPFAIEGESLFEHPNAKYGELKLVVIGEFRSKSDPARKNVRDVLESHNVRMIAVDQLDNLVQEIIATGKEVAL